MMKVSRSIRKKCNRVILIAFAAAMLAVCISPALASATYIPPDPTDLANTTGRYWVNYTWQAGSGWHLIAGEVGGGFYGYNWTGSAWQSDSAIASDLPDVGNYSAPTVFQKGGDWYLIAGEAGGGFHGYNWTGSAWQNDSAIVSSLPDSGGPDARDHSAPTVFQKDGFWYLISGEMDGGFYGYNWTDSAWQNDSAIVNGLLDVGNYSAPAVFQKGEEWYLIAGEAGGGFHGYKWTDSAWQSDNAIARLTDVGDHSTPAVFDMGSNVTDSYNISVNGVWHNGTTNTSINETVGPDVWVNITIWAWNASGTGTLSAVCVSDNAQAWAEPDSTFGLVGSVPSGGDGTYPPGWFETPTPAVTATKALAASATATATDAPPGERVTPMPVPTKAKPAAAKATAPAAEGTAAETAKKDAPGFTAVFAAAGVLAIAYAMMRRRG